MRHASGRSPENACRDKRYYEKASEARRTIREMEARRGRKGSRLSAYRCPFCHGWHVGNSKDYGYDIVVTEYGEKGWRASCYPRGGGGVASAEFYALSRADAYRKAREYTDRSKE